MDLYQSLVTVNPVTLIAQICNLFIQLFLAKKFFLDITLHPAKRELKAAKSAFSSSFSGHHTGHLFHHLTALFKLFHQTVYLADVYTGTFCDAAFSRWINDSRIRPLLNCHGVNNCLRSFEGIVINF